MSNEPELDFSIDAIVRSELVSIIGNLNYTEFPQCFVFPERLEYNSILFIGINPSSGEKDKAGLISYPVSQSDSEHQYFRKFEDISKFCKTKWSHIDLLYFKETKQDKVHDILRTEIGKEFVWRQLQLSDKLIRKSAAKVIVVNNTLARDLLGFGGRGWLDYKFLFDDELGTYLWGETPVFFTSMLTGQRALDIGSYERLRWHIKKALVFRLERQLELVRKAKEILKSRQEYESLALEHDKERRISEELEQIKF